ncbi:hypothetical protein CHUAL_011370, partial [Chamberlinius hualienensis]
MAKGNHFSQSNFKLVKRTDCTADRFNFNGTVNLNHIRFVVTVRAYTQSVDKVNQFLRELNKRNQDNWCSMIILDKMTPPAFGSFYDVIMADVRAGNVAPPPFPTDWIYQL